jgi:hypothetical protein
MAVMTSAGSTIGISSSLPATEDATGYNALTYVLAGEITDMGEVGKEFNTVNHSPLGSRRVIKIKGSYNNGTMAVQMGRDFSDAGQAAFQAALQVDVPQSIKLTLQNGKKLYFKALVSSFKYNIGGVDSVTAATANLELISDIVEV